MVAHVLKLYAWEPSFEQQVLKIRDKEMKVLKQAAYLNACTSFIWSCAPFLVSLVTFAVYVLIDDQNILDSEKAFVSLSLFNILRFPLSMLPMLISNMVQHVFSHVRHCCHRQRPYAVAVAGCSPAFYRRRSAVGECARFRSLIQFTIGIWTAGVSVKRINKFMNSEELDPNCVQHDQSEFDPVVVENGTFSWGGMQEEAVVLRNINVRVKQASLVAVVGTVGSGKSSLLSAILGEMEKLTGRVNTKGSIAYVPQQAWIQNATLKDNILFGQGYEPNNYTKITRACALQQDFDMLPAGDLTEIGEKGINLSGGQKQRVSLARAVYSNSDIYLLDDPLSAVDSHVGKHIFENVIGHKGVLKKKTRILVTHAITYLPEVDLIVVLKEGQVTESGTYKELLAQKGAFADFLVQYLQEAGEEDQVDLPEEMTELLESNVELKQKLARQRSRDSESSTHSLQRQRSSSESTNPDTKLLTQNHTAKKQGDKLIEAEKAETGSVKKHVYMHYLKSVGAVLTLVTIGLNILFQMFSIGSNIWLSRWSSDTSLIVNGTQDEGKRDMYLSVYAGLGLGQVYRSR
ncbi:Canalicular multispecific organic anion transporter 1 [Homalodisca vitripennis]|nr:Canalicular multispecific organic anion transporter 1 [Homalodisca vitripennis]